MSSHPRHKTREELDPVKDASFIARIEHSKTCPHWSVIENVCECHLYAEWDKLTPEERLKVAKDKAHEEKLDKVDERYNSFKENGY